jgi:hypothetical protein
MQDTLIARRRDVCGDLVAARWAVAKLPLVSSSASRGASDVADIQG